MLWQRPCINHRDNSSLITPLIVMIQSMQVIKGEDLSDPATMAMARREAISSGGSLHSLTARSGGGRERAAEERSRGEERRRREERRGEETQRGEERRGKQSRGEERRRREERRGDAERHNPTFSAQIGERQR